MRVGSLFSGIGGIDLAFSQAGYHVLWANEFDKNACKTYRHNFPEVQLFDNDILKLNPSFLRDVDIIVAGFPCQPFSVCGKKKGFQDRRGNLFFEIMRIADSLSPPLIFLENVANLVEHDSGKTFNIIHNELTERGYYIRYTIADACDYDIPQHRTRTYIVAFRDYSVCSRFAFPEKKTLEKRIFDVIDRTGRVCDQYYLPIDSAHYRQLDTAMQDNDQIYRFSDYGVQASKDGISFTLKANMGTWRDRVPYIRDSFGIRKITPKECLALQGFPYWFDFPDIPLQCAYKQCGNTVVVPLVCSIAKQIKAACSSNF